jgi:hypothetical protein
VEKTLVDSINRATDRVMRENDYNPIEEADGTRYYRHRRTGELFAVNNAVVREIK